MPSCEYNHKISAYHDGELPTEERRDLKEHIQECSSCAQELQELRSLSRFFAAAEMPGMSSDALDSLHRHVGSVRDVFVLQMAERLMTAAAALLVVCAVWFWQTARVQDSGTRGLEVWEIAPISLQTGMPAASSTEEMFARWIVWDLSRENGSD